VRDIPPEDDIYWFQVRIIADMMRSDGCTGVAEFYRDSCLEHDIHWRTGRTIHGLPLTTAQSNTRFRLVIQSRSRLGRFSPLSWWRYVGVSIGALFIAHKTT
jgi:hypothetical protein